ncbi:amino acid permease [Vibrio algicola]|uniref:Amino acid permease n=1 Tax=Vibrio algicola TaxID=2662262 RepID=A0A5Q0TFR9_9VIBR|nr:aromatic amino acid transport family protein [Vibrio algicola]
MKLFGSSLILAGTALGAGMLGIPMALAQFGFTVSLILMTVIFVGTTYGALLLAEACTKTAQNGGMNSVAELTLGTGGKYFINFFFYMLLICILVAYTLGIGDLFHNLLLEVGLDVAQPICYAAFTFVMAFVIIAGKSYIDILNRVLFILMIGMLLTVVATLFTHIEPDYLAQTPVFQWQDVVKHSTTIFTSFGSMVVIPSLVMYNKEADGKQIRNMILLGSVIPLVCYLTWLFAIIGNLGTAEISQFDNVSQLISAFGGQSGALKTIISIFSALALITSFLGVSMALFDQNKDGIKGLAKTLNLNSGLVAKVAVFALTFILPLVVTGLFSNKFLNMLEYAGITLVFLAIWGPLAMVLRVRKPSFQLMGMKEPYTAGGGSVALIMSFFFGAFILMSWFFN